MTTDELISRISAAAAADDLAGLQRYLHELHHKMRNEGRPVGSTDALRLVKALCDTQLEKSGGPDPYKLAGQIKEAVEVSPVDLNKLNTSWTTLETILRDPTSHIDDDEIIGVMMALRNARVFDRLAEAGERAIVRMPDNARVRLLYGQALIDLGQVHAGLEMVRTVLSLRGVSQTMIDEAHGLLGRGHKQIYVNQIRTPTAPLTVRDRLKPDLERALFHYRKAYHPESPGEGYWHGINYIALMVLAREDGHPDLATFDGLKPEQLAVRMIDALEPLADATGDNWLLATLGEAAIALRDFQRAKYWYTEFGHHPKTLPFHAASASRQLEEVWRLTPSHGGAGPLFSVLKAAEIGNPNGQFSLPSESLRDIEKFAGTIEANDFRESMVAGGHFVPLAELQTVVKRAQAVVAIQGNYGGTIGTGFLVSGRSLNASLGDDIYMVTNAHVMSELGGEGTLHPGHARLILEGSQNAELNCDGKLIWESPPNEYDVAIVRITGGARSSVQPLEFAEPDMPLGPANPNTGSEGAPVSVIGYPLGGPLSLGRVVGANGRLVDMGPRQANGTKPIYMHYVAPTEPGNSGSPIFETRSWRVIGLHHAGFDQYNGRPRLNGVGGSSFANEGICIQSIRSQLKNVLGGGRPRSIFGS